MRWPRQERMSPSCLGCRGQGSSVNLNSRPNAIRNARGVAQCSEAELKSTRLKPRKYKIGVPYLDWTDC